MQHWTRCKEQPENGGIHYYRAIKLTGNTKWKSVKKNISKKHNITLHFCDKNLCAYRFIGKEDTEVAHSQ